MYDKNSFIVLKKINEKKDQLSFFLNRMLHFVYLQMIAILKINSTTYV